MTEARKEAREILKGINESIAHKNYTISCGYACDESPSIDYTNSWQLKSEIANRVAIALLPKDAIENIDEIIAKIASEIAS